MASHENVELITFWAAPYGLRAELALTSKGISFQRLLEVDHIQHKSQRLLEANPLHKMIPVLIHNGKPIPDSFILIEYVDQTWPSPDGKNLLPKDPYQRSVARFWADYVDKKLYRSLRNNLLTTGEAQKAAIEETMEHLSRLEEALGSVVEGGPFFGGASVGLVDVIMGPLVAWFPTHEAVGNFKFRFHENFPRISAWIKAIQASPCGSCLPDSDKISQYARKLRETVLLQQQQSIQL